jgi:hypothetical protein
MSDPDSPNEPTFRSLPPPPARPPRSGKGCLHAGLLGCGGLVILGIVAFVVIGFWFKRNAPDIELRAGEAAREGARYGITADETGCFAEAVRRANASTTVAGSFTVGAYARACMEYSRQSPGFCDNVPPPTALRRALAWHQERCGTDTGCRTVGQVVQQYCADDRPKRVPADTLKMTDSPGWEQDLPRPADTVKADTVEADTVKVDTGAS